MLGVTGQNLLGQNPPFSDPPLTEIKIRQTGLEQRLIGIFFQFPPDFLLGLLVFLALFEETDAICFFGERFFPVRLGVSL